MPNVGPTPTGNIFLDTFEPVIDPNEVPPTAQIEGSSSGIGPVGGVGNPDSPTNTERAAVLFPFFDGQAEQLSSNPISQDGITEYLFELGEPTQLPTQDANGNDLPGGNLFPISVPFPEAVNDLPLTDFLGFHSSHQMQFIFEKGVGVPGSPSAQTVTFNQDGIKVDIVAIEGERRVFVLQQLTKADLATIAPETEGVLANALTLLDQAEITRIESVLGASAGAGTLEEVTKLLDAASSEVRARFSPVDDEIFSSAERDSFRDVFDGQIANIRNRATNSSFLDINEIRGRVEDIRRRAERADEFFKVVKVPPSRFAPGSDQFTNVNLPIGADISQSRIREGFDTFIAQETRLRDLDNQRLQLSETGFLNGGRALDGPNLIAIFQLNYNLTREAEVNAETEELNQQNALLQVYAAVQQLVNDALGAFGTGDDGANETRTISGSLGEGLEFDSLSQEEQNLVAFVEDRLVELSTIGHPIETLRNIDRPTLDIIKNSTGELNKFSQNQWSIFASQLADTVTQINQESQILTNEVSSLNRERNRNFDLANNALRRLNDTLLTIARA